MPHSARVGLVSGVVTLSVALKLWCSPARPACRSGRSTRPVLPAKDLLSLIDRDETQIERAGVNLLSYIVPGGEHTVLSDGTFYTEE